MARRKPKPLPPIVIYVDQPCKNNQVYVHPVDGSCLRCGADQGVARWHMSEHSTFGSV